ncbi:MAG: AAA family ATPase, partial [Lachnospiraceae bacterium]|nr:AAA family ATPase [Lachnospiraceae bacterium]
MNIATAKEQIKNAVRIYLQKNADGSYQIPVVHQRPVFVMGPPGLGKTAIMQQIADEMGLGLVSYSMTHHTRQSALGLPVIVDREFDGTHYQVSEYTMSEILASVYDCMRETGKREGILFLDEINCVSETLSPAMLLFLQYKVFGGHQVPPGWVIVTAGNPPRFNKSAHELDAATRDRLKVMNIEPDYAAFKEYAIRNGVQRCVISYLDIRPDDFYKMTTQVNGMNVVTPRAWEDLSEMIRYHEMLGIPVTDALVSQYLQDPDTARDFALYYQLYQKYKKAWQTDRILQGLYDEEVLDEAKEARTDERITLVGLLLEQVTGDMDLCV